MGPSSTLFEACAAFAAASILGLTLTPVVRAVGARALLQGRSRHAGQVPRVGGIAILLAVAATCAPFLAPYDTRAVGVPALAVLAVFLVGLAHDVSAVPLAARLAVQAAAAVLMYVAGLRIEVLGTVVGGPLGLGALSLPVTVVWFVALSNAVNLIDRLEGLAAGIGLFSALTFFLAAVLNERWDVAVPTAALAGALLGFLRYNFEPASIFLGNCGSLTIGFVLAAFAVAASMKSPAVVAVTAPLAILALPLLDSALLIARDFLRGEPGARAQMAITPGKAIFVLYGAAGLLGLASMLATSHSARLTGVVLIVVGCTAWVGIQRLGYAEFGEVGRVVHRGLWMQKQMVGNNLHLLDVRARLRTADSLDAVWADLVGLAQRVGFSAVALSLEAEVARELGRSGAGPLEWKGRETGGRCWTWSLPVWEGEDVVATLVFERSLEEGALHFEPGYLLEVAREDLSQALARCRRAATARRAG